MTDSQNNSAACGSAEPGLRSGKTLLRKSVLALRDALAPTDRVRKDQAITKRLSAFDAFERAGTVLLYAAFRSEVGTEGLMNICLEQGKTVAFPRVDHDALRLFVISSAADLTPGCWGIPEPAPLPEREIGIAAVDVVLAPGAAFDTTGNRLGYGKGFYDRLLAQKAAGAPLPVVVGLAYEEQLVPSLPHNSHDIAMDFIITDRRTIHCHGQ